MAITKIENEKMVTYSLGDEKVLVATFEGDEKISLKIEGAIKTLVAPCLDEVIKKAMSRERNLLLIFHK